MNNHNAAMIAAGLVSAWLANPATRATADDAADFFSKMYSAVDGGLTEPKPEPVPEYIPAVSVRQSLASKDHIVSMLDGKPYKMLKRHLTTHGLTPETYRERYGLKPDYPMVAENYSNSRRAIALAAGLGHGTHQRTSGDKA